MTAEELREVRVLDALPASLRVLRGGRYWLASGRLVRPVEVREAGVEIDADGLLTMESRGDAA